MMVTKLVALPLIHLFVASDSESVRWVGAERAWIDKNEGVVGSPHCLVDRADALEVCDCAIVVLSDTYMRCPRSQVELMLIRSRIIGKFVYVSPLAGRVLIFLSDTSPLLTSSAPLYVHRRCLTY